MAKGKFSQPRSPKREEQELEQAFQEVTGQAPESPDPAPTSEESSSAIEKNKKIILISLCSVALVVLIGIIATVCFLVGSADDDGLILNNVTVAGVNLGGMTRDQAEDALRAATDHTYTQQDMVIVLPDATITLTPADTGAKLDVEAAVKAAYQYGRTGSRAERESAKAQSLTGAYHIALLPYMELDTDYIRQALEEYCASFSSDFVQSSVEWDGDKPELEGDRFDASVPCQTLLLNPGVPGRHLDADTLYNQVLDAYSFNTFLVEVDLASLGDAPDALDLDALYEEYCSEPVDAILDPETLEIIPEVYGYAFDLEKAKELLAEAEPGTVIGIPMEYVEPELLSSEIFGDVLASYETEHTKDENRNTNLALACAAINGYVLMPGDTFDYNQVLGQRTAEAGYKAAGAYVGGQTVKEIGGGICQVSSTLYYCTLIADMEIVTRKAHGFVSSYMPMGMDATVSWGGPDFRFRNNTEHAIRIEAEVSDGYVHVRLMGMDDKDYYVEMEYDVIGVFSYETVYEEYAPNNDKGYKDGDVIQTPYTGYTVKTYKCKYDKVTGELISKEFEALSQYSSRDLIIAKIVTETEPTTAPTEAPTEPTQAPTEAPPEATQAPTEAPTEAPAEPPADTGADAA